MSQLTKIADQPDTLNAAQISDLSENLSYESSKTSVVGLATAFENKIALEPNSPKIHGYEEEVVLKNMGDIINFSSDADKETNDFAINYHKRAALDPFTAVEANGRLLGISSSMSEHDFESGFGLVHIFAG